MQIFKVAIEIYSIVLIFSLLGLVAVRPRNSMTDLALVIIFAIGGLTYILHFLNKVLGVKYRVRTLRRMELLISLAALVLFTGLIVMLTLNRNTMDNNYIILAFLPLPIAFFRRMYRFVKSSARFRSRFNKPPKSKNDVDAQELENTAELSTKLNPEAEVGELVDTESKRARVEEPQKRAFLKLLGGAGLGLLVHLMINPRQASAAFFGSVPGPGTVSLKDSNNQKIDPAIKSPTDAYGISEVDDSSTPAYYGFVNKDGAWYITQEDSTGSYRYAKGDSDFSTNWSNRASMSYNYFDNVF